MTKATTSTSTKTTEITSRVRTEIRRHAGVTRSGAMPVVVVDGSAGPKVRGRGFQYETKGGTVIDHPSAYSKFGWSNMVYCHSTRRVEVGREWLRQQGYRDYCEAGTVSASC
jgi:hypothetical protein